MVIFFFKTIVLTKIFMNDLFQKDLGSILLSFAVLLGWIGLSFTLLRVVLLSIKKILEKVSSLSSK